MPETQPREPRLADITFSMPGTIDEQVEDMRKSIRVFKPNASPNRVEEFLDLLKESLVDAERNRILGRITKPPIPELRYIGKKGGEFDDYEAMRFSDGGVTNAELSAFVKRAESEGRHFDARKYLGILKERKGYKLAF